MIPYLSFDAFSLGPLTFHTWGIFFAIGACTVFLLSIRKNKKARVISLDAAYSIFLYIIVGAIVGARLFFVLQFPTHYFSHPLDILKLWEGGMMSYGGIVGGTLFAVLYCVRKGFSQKNIARLADIIGLYIPLGFFWGRMGNFLTTEHQGGVTSLFWGQRWSDGSIRHPISLYLAVSILVVFGILTLFARKKHQPGFIFGLFVVLYGFHRFFLDFFRARGTQLSNPAFLTITNAQWLSLLAVVMFVPIVVHLYSSK